MSQSLGTAVLELSADPSKLRSTLAATRTSVVSDFRKTGAALRTAMVSSLALAGVAIGAALFRLGRSFEGAYNNIRRGTGATGRALEGLKKDFREVVKDVPADFDTASNVIADLNTRLGLTGKPLRERSKQFLELSRITGEDVSTSIRNVTRLFGDWSVRSNRQGRTLDYLFRMSQTTGIGVNDLARQMTDFGSPLRQLGFDFETAAAMFGKFEREGVNIQTLMPGLKMALKNLSQPTRDTERLLRRLGVAGRDPDIALRAVMEAIRNARSTMQANRMAFAVFGARAGPDMAAAIREGRFELDDLMTSVADGRDTIMGVGRETMTFSEKLRILKNKGLVLLEPAAMAVVGAMDKLADWSIKASRTMERWIPRIRAFIEALVGSKSVRAAIDWIKSVTERQFRAITKAVSGAITMITGVIKTFSALLRGDFRRMWEGIKQTFSGALTTLKGIFLTYTAPIREAASRVMGSVKSAVDSAWNSIKTATSNAWNAVKTAIVTPIDAAVSAVNRAVSAAQRWLTGAWNNITKATSKAWAATRDAVTKPVADAVGAVQGAVAALRRWLGQRWNEIRSAADTAWQRIKDFIGNPINAAVTRVRNLIDRVKTWLSQRWNEIRSATNQAWQRIKDFIGNPIDAARTRVRSIIGSVRTWLSARWDDIKNTANNAWQRVKELIGNPISKAVDTVRRLIGRDGLAGWLAGKWEDIKKGVGKFGTGVKETLEKAFKGAANGVIGFLNKIIDAINKLPGVKIGKIPELAQGGKIGGRASAAANVGFYAQGGKVTRPLAIVGEEAPRHPEYVIPTNPAYRGRAISLTQSLMGELGMDVPQFFLGGIFGGIAKGAGGIFNGMKKSVAKVAGLPLGLLEHGAKWILNMLPQASDIGPNWLKGLGSNIISKITKWVKDKVAGIFSGKDDAGDQTGIEKLKRVAAMGEQADKMDRMNTPYVYGGGHGSFNGPWDCSGAVSAVLHAGGFLSSPMTTDGLKVWGAAGDGQLFTVGVRGSTGRNAHTMMKLGSRYFESGGGAGAGWRSGWNGHFPIHRYAPGYARGGILQPRDIVAEIRKDLIPGVLGWGLRKGGLLGGLPYAGNFGGGGRVGGKKGAPSWAVVHGGEWITEDVPQVHLHFDNGMEWLRRFVRVEIRQSARDAHAAYRAGLRP